MVTEDRFAGRFNRQAISVSLFPRFGTAKVRVVFGKSKRKRKNNLMPFFSFQLPTN
jgi:hypothetical protein